MSVVTRASMVMFVRCIALTALTNAAVAASWSCYGTKPGHPTPAERTAFVQEMGRLSIEAERKHGVPASALAALAIVESGYGWTRLALEANNLFAWRLGPTDAQQQKSHVPICQRQRRTKDHYAVFETRAAAFDVVAGKLATLDAYRGYTDRYREARRRGAPVEPAVKAWLEGIAKRYSRSPDDFTRKLVRIMNDPEARGEPMPQDQNLYELSRKAHIRH